MPQVSFARDIGPLFRDVDISHMEVHGIKLDDYTFMSDPENANKCSKHFRRTKATRLPCHPEGPIGQWTSSRCSPSGRTRATSLKPRSRAAEGLRLQRDKAQGVAILLARYRWLALPARNHDAIATRWRFRRVL